jgi:hypothetical protein
MSSCEDPQSNNSHDGFSSAFRNSRYSAFRAKIFSASGMQLRIGKVRLQLRVIDVTDEAVHQLQHA